MKNIMEMPIIRLNGSSYINDMELKERYKVWQLLDLPSVFGGKPGRSDCYGRWTGIAAFDDGSGKTVENRIGRRPGRFSCGRYVLYGGTPPVCVERPGVYEKSKIRRKPFLCGASGRDGRDWCDARPEFWLETIYGPLPGADFKIFWQGSHYPYQIQMPEVVCNPYPCAESAKEEQQSIQPPHQRIGRLLCGKNGSVCNWHLFPLFFGLQSQKGIYHVFLREAVLSSCETADFLYYPLSAGKTGIYGRWILYSFWAFYQILW